MKYFLFIEEHSVRHRRSKERRRKVGVTISSQSKSKLARHKDSVLGSYDDQGEKKSGSVRVRRAATARPERIWDYAVIPYEIDSNFRQEKYLNDQREFLYTSIYYTIAAK